MGAGVGVRIVQRVSSTPAFAKVAPHLIPAMDRAVHRLTRGKVLLSAQMLPGVILTARGAKSGLPRRTPLACMPEGGKGREGTSWILIGSNFGRTDHPAWTANLLAHPDAEVNWKGRDIPVTAQLLRGEERDTVWKALLEFWPPYATYQARVEREIRLFRIVRREAPGTSGTSGTSESSGSATGGSPPE
ncbi:nitroreductase family deazaflavin-dependent oxidoreductase [Streptomyces sp. 2-1]|uniref:nitroreductase family deazaflavin-dependent oxidoreductase n=1 Tax=Streptomyces sp. 2-1 TaxID=412710 RepID=UPI003AFA08F8